MTPQEELRKFRESQVSPQELLKQFRTESGGGSRRRLGSFDNLVVDAKSEDPDFDYKTGARGGLRAKLSFMETAEEKENFLRQRLGDEGFTKDSKGNLALTPAGQAKEGMEPIGKNLIIEDKGFTLRDFSDVAGLVPETVGSIVGGILGAPGLVTGAAGAAAGAAAGQTIEEAIEGLMGLQKQTGQEVLTDVAKEAALAGAVDFATVGTYKLIRGAVNVAGKGANAAARATGQVQNELNQEGAERALRLLDKDALPSYEAAGMLEALSRLSQISESIGGGKKRGLKNIGFALNEKAKLLEKYGAASSEELASILGKAAPETAKKLQKDIKKAQKAGMVAINDSLNILTQSTRGGGEIEDFILKSLTDNYESFIKTTDAEWAGIDETLSNIRGTIELNGQTVEATGGQLPIFDIQAFKTKFDDVIRDDYAGATGLPPEEFVQIGNDIAQLTKAGAEEGFTSFNGMKNLRKKIQDTLMDPKLSTGETTARRYLSDVRDRIDEMMYGKIEMKYTGLDKNSVDFMKGAMKQLESARASYNAEIGLYQGLERLNILRNVGEAGKNVKLVAGRYFDDIVNTPGRVNAVLKASEKELKDEAGTIIRTAAEQKEEVRKTLAQRFVDNALTAGKNDFGDPDKFSGVLFNNYINGKALKKSGKIIFGDDWEKVQRISKSLAYDGIKTMDNEVLEKALAQNPPDKIVNSLKSIRDAQIGLEEAMSSKIVREISEGKLDPQDAATQLISPKTTIAEMNRIMDFFKKDPAAQETIRKTVINDILNSVDKDIFVDAKSGFSLQNALDAYKPKMLEKVLGKQTVDDLKEFSLELAMLSDTGKRGAGALAAEAIRTGAFTSPIKNASKMARFKFLDFIFNRPATLRTALELKTGKRTPEQAAQTVSQVLNEAATQVGSGKTVGERVSGVAKGLGAFNRGRVIGRQATGQLLTSPQQVRGTAPANQTSVPDVRPPITMDDVSMRRFTEAPDLSNIQNLRERAKKNPYIAATLLGGLGSAGLL